MLFTPFIRWEDQPAFHHSYDFLRGHKQGVIKINPAVADRISRDNLNGTIHPRHLPMLTPPRPWLGIEDGGYLTSKSMNIQLSGVYKF